MQIAPISAYKSNPYRSNPQNLKVLNDGNKPAQPAFEGRVGRGVLAGLTALFISIGAHAQSTAAKIAEKAPEFIDPKILQFNPKGLNVVYLAPWEKAITQESLTSDSIKLVKQINTYNKFQSIPNGWDGKGATPEKAYKIISDSYDNFLVDKVRYFVTTGQIEEPPNNAIVANVASGTQLKLGERSTALLLY